MLWREERKREHRRSVTQLPLRIKNPKGAHRAPAHEKSHFFWSLNVHLSMYQCDWLHRFSRTSVKVTRAGALIPWLWYFSWIAERTMNVKSFNCSFLGRTHTTAQEVVRTYSCPPRSLASLLHEQTLDCFHKNLITKSDHLSRYRDSSSGPKVFSH